MQQDNPTKIQATVNTRLLSKAQRLFTGTLHGRIIEILQNARRAGATEVKITNDNGQVTVTDNGKGIAEGDRARIFDPFFTTRRSGGGTGMGLAITRAMLEANGAEITLLPSTSGAKFEIRF